MKSFDKDVNGLRAFAILVVMAFHYGSSLFSGGFVGVDIFFVISGYVISLGILEKIRNQTFSFPVYLKNRFFRIFPALLIASILTLVASAIILFPADANRTAWHALASISFVSNFVFWKEVGYFDVENDFKPFLHTWSLSVEWQFYLLWPIALYVLCVLRRFAILLLAFGILCGILLSGILSSYVNFTFYMMPLRGWEFALGALIAFVPADRRIRQSLPILSVLGVLGMFVSSILYTENTVFPGYSAALPCVSAFLFLFFSRQYITPVFRIGILQYLGNISYSLYLYHWPVFVLYKYLVFRELMLFDMIAVLIVVFLFAHLSYLYIETPFRRPASDRTRFRMPVLLGAMVLSVTVSCFVIATEGKTGRYNASENKLIAYFASESEKYKQKYGVTFPLSAEEEWLEHKHLNMPCAYDNYKPPSADDLKIVTCIANNFKHNPDRKGRYLVIGDSNGKNVYEALVLAFPDRSFSLLLRSGCAAVETKDCFPYLKDQLREIFQRTNIDGVILSSCHTYQVVDGVEETVSFLKDNNMNFMIVGATPALRKTLEMVMLRKGITLESGEFFLPLNAAFFQPDILDTDAYLQTVAASYGGVFWDKKDALCPEHMCALLRRDYKNPLYLDSQHLSEDGIDVLVNAMQKNDVFTEFFGAQARHPQLFD